MIAISGVCMNKRISEIILAMLLLLLAAPVASASLPSSFNGWQTKSFLPITADRISDFAAENAPVIREYGFVSGIKQEYAKGESRLSVTLWQMNDTTGAFGLFTYFRQPDMANVISTNDTDFIAAGGNQWLIHRGRYVVEVRGDGWTLGDSSLLMEKVPLPKGSIDIPPTLPYYLPEDKLIPQSPRFFVGPVAFERLENVVPSSAIGFDLGAEAAMADYKVNGKTLRLLLVSYATPQLAAKKLEGFQKLPLVANADSNNQVYIKRKGPIVGFVLNASQSAAADLLLDNIAYESSLTWNEYVPGPKDNVGIMMMSIFGLAGLVLLMAFVAGIAFGGVRILAQRFLPFPVFDRPADTEIIKLQLLD